MERESIDSGELYRLDEAIRSTMEAIRRSPQFGGTWTGGFQGQGTGFQGGGWQPGQNVDRVADAIQARIVEGIRERVGEAVREQLRHPLRERVSETIREHLGQALREELRQTQLTAQPG